MKPTLILLALSLFSCSEYSTDLAYKYQAMRCLSGQCYEIIAKFSDQKMCADYVLRLGHNCMSLREINHSNVGVNSPVCFKSFDSTAHHFVCMERE